MGTLKINDQYAVKSFTYEDGAYKLTGNARYNEADVLTNIDGGSVSKDGSGIGNYYVYTENSKLKTNINNVEMDELVTVVGLVNDLISALQGSDE